MLFIVGKLGTPLIINIDHKISALSASSSNTTPFFVNHTVPKDVAFVWLKDVDEWFQFVFVEPCCFNETRKRKRSRLGVVSNLQIMYNTKFVIQNRLVVGLGLLESRREENLKISRGH